MRRMTSRSAGLLSVLFIVLGTIQLAHGLPGDLDTSFGGDGFAIAEFGANGLHDSDPSGIAIQSNGRIVVSGFAHTSGLNFDQTALVVVRFNSNGTLDGTFGSGGKVLTDFGPGFHAGNAVAIQADEKIVVAGITAASTSSSSPRFIALARYNSNGTLDTTFGGDGKVTSTFAVSSVTDVAIQSDGKILVVGAANGDFLLVRFLSSGSPDNFFGVSSGFINLGGAVVTDFGGVEGASAVALQDDGKIVVVGSSVVAGDGVFALARYSAAGLLDPTFGGNGRVTTNFVAGDHGSQPGDAALDVAIQANGRIVVVGQAETDTGLARTDFALARYTTTGALDTTFGNGGRVLTAFVPGDPQRANDVASAVAMQPDGKIVAAGLTGVPFSEVFALARYNANGTLDTTFGGDGKVTTDRRGFFGRAVAVQKADGRLVLAGKGDTDDPLGSGIALARFHAFTCGGRDVTILGTNGPDTLTGGSRLIFRPDFTFTEIHFDDVIHGLGGRDNIDGRGGNDTICGGDGDDTLIGGPGNDVLIAGTGLDSLNGGTGTDVCSGSANPFIFGDPVDSFAGCETVNTGFSGLSGEWMDVEQHCNRSRPEPMCRLKGSLRVFNPGTDTTAVPTLAAFYLSEDEVLDENDTFVTIADVRALAPGGSEIVKLNVTLPGVRDLSGSFVIAVVDYTDIVSERSEDNNVAVSPPIGP